MKSKSVFDKYYKEYDAWYEKKRFVYLSELKALKKVLPKRGAKGLEIGVGTGRFASRLGVTSGVEPSRNMARIAKRRGINVKIGFGERLPYKREEFDYVIIIISLCFVKNPRKVLGEAARVLKKRGKLIIGIVDKHSFLGKFYRKKKSVFYKKARFFGVKELDGLLKKKGFDKFSYSQTIFKLPHELKKVETPRKGFGKGGFVVIACRKMS